MQYTTQTAGQSVGSRRRCRQRLFLRLLTSLLLLLTCVQVLAVDIKLVGVEKDLRAVMRATIERPEDDSEEGIAEFLKNVPKRVQQTMQSVGFYNAKVCLLYTSDAADE